MTEFMKIRDATAETDVQGKFVRTAAGYREIISNEHPIFKPEFDRYHLYISYACPWANRCLAVLKLKGLETCIKFTVVHPTWQRTKPDNPNDQHCGWAFYQSNSQPPLSNPNGHGSFSPSGCDPDPNAGANFIRDLYEKSNDTLGKFSVPVLWDKYTNTIVNNESSEIVRMFTKEFDAWATGPMAGLDLYPVSLRSSIDEVNGWIYPNINDGVYKCGFAKSQIAYDEAVTNLYAALNRLEEHLGTSRFLNSNSAITEADIRLFMTLVRFDEVYVVYFKCNVRRISDYNNIHNYVRDIYQMHGMSDCINMEHIKIHYYR